jgi:hypothetical protein
MAKIQITNLAKVPGLSELSECQERQILGGADIVVDQTTILKDNRLASAINFIFIDKNVSNATVIQILGT